MTYDDIDRMFYELIRLKTVAVGYLPDIVLYSDEPSYNAAKTALKATTQYQQLIEIFGIGTDVDQGEKISSRIVIRRDRSAHGSIGSSGVTYTAPITNDAGNTIGFSKSQYPDKSRDIHYEVRILSDNAQLMKLMYEIVDDTLGDLRYLNTFNGTTMAFTTDAVLLEWDGESSLDGNEFQETIRRYIVRDVYVQSFTTLTTSLVPMTSVHYSVYLNTNTNQAGQTPDLVEVIS